MWSGVQGCPGDTVQLNTAVLSLDNRQDVLNLVSSVARRPALLQSIALDTVSVHPNTTARVALQHRPVLIVPVDQRGSCIVCSKIVPKHCVAIDVDAQHACTEHIDDIDAQEASNGVQMVRQILNISSADLRERPDYAARGSPARIPRNIRASQEIIESMHAAPGANLRFEISWQS